MTQAAEWVKKIEITAGVWQQSGFTCSAADNFSPLFTVKNVEDAHGSSHTLVVKSRPVVRRLKILGYHESGALTTELSPPPDRNHFVRSVFA